MSQSKYSFIRTELRTLQNICGDDNEKFLNALADMIGFRDEKISRLEAQNWQNNPDRSGGMFTDDEINDIGK